MSKLGNEKKSCFLEESPLIQYKDEVKRVDIRGGQRSALMAHFRDLGGLFLQ